MLELGGAYKTVVSMVNTWIALLPKLLVAVLLLALAVVVGRSVRKLVRRVVDGRTTHHHAGIVLGSLAMWSVVTAGGLIALSVVVPSFKASDLLQLLGITGVAVGFAFKDILQNFLAGLILLVTEPFRIGDEIAAGGFEGKVEEVQTRATLLRTVDGRRAVIPNSTLFTSAVMVHTAFGERRGQLEVVVAGQDLAATTQRLRQAAAAVPGVLQEPPPEITAVELAGDQVKLRVTWWVAAPFHDEGQVRVRMVQALREALPA